MTRETESDANSIEVPEPVEDAALATGTARRPLPPGIVPDALRNRTPPGAGGAWPSR